MIGDVTRINWSMEFNRYKAIILMSGEEKRVALCDWFKTRVWSVDRVVQEPVEDFTDALKQSDLMALAAQVGQLSVNDEDIDAAYYAAPAGPRHEPQTGLAPQSTELPATVMSSISILPCILLRRDHRSRSR